MDRMIGDLSQHRAEVERGIESAEFGGADESVERGCAFAAGIGAKEQVILSSNRYGAQRPLSTAVIDLQQTIIDITCERAPSGQGWRMRAGGSQVSEICVMRPQVSRDF